MPARRDIIAAIFGALISLSVCLWWNLSQKEAAPSIEGADQGGVKGMEDLPAMIRGDFYSDHLSIEDLLADNFLDSLIRGSMKKEVVDSMYGKPICVTRNSDCDIVSYNLAVYDERLRSRGGRVGFVATFRNGRMIKWSPTIQKRGL